MIERGKFRSLTLINWNGFFARTFDLDELVTTLSGGNGAGKSTTVKIMCGLMEEYCCISVTLRKPGPPAVRAIKVCTVS